VNPLNSIGRHARDNKLHVWTRIVELPASQRVGGGSASAFVSSSYGINEGGINDPTHHPTLVFSMDVNALNFCRFSLLKMSSAHLCVHTGSTSRENDEDGDGEENALIALPNLIDSEVVCLSFIISLSKSVENDRQTYGL
jgi:hypothetical protein